MSTATHAFKPTGLVHGHTEVRFSTRPCPC